MRPAPIPNDVARDEPGERMVIGPPYNNLDFPVSPIEAMRLDAGDHFEFAVRCILEPGDLETLQADGAVWVTFWGHVVPFTVRTGV